MALPRGCGLASTRRGLGAFVRDRGAGIRCTRPRSADVGFEHRRIGKAGDYRLGRLKRFGGSLGDGRKIVHPLGDRLALGGQSIDRGGSRIGRALRFATLALGGGRRLALLIAFGPPTLDIARSLVARRRSAFDGFLELRQLLVEVRQTVRRGSAARQQPRPTRSRRNRPSAAICHRE